jgi:formylglycine-generating enzyme required for sulfatase activity
LSWDDCQVALTRAGWLRLPTEAQWEYGCRARTSTTWWPGDEAKDLSGVANINLGDDSPSGELAIGDRRANDFGLHDVHGNASEWCNYTTWGLAEPRVGDGLSDNAFASDRPYRGGGAWDKPENARSSYRISHMRDYRHGGLRPSRGITP